MIRKRSNGDTQVSLFPFLSILSCVIGTLTLLIAGLTAGAVAEPGSAPAEEHARLASEITDARREVDRLEPLIATAVAVADRLEAARKEHERLKASKAEADLAQGEVVRLESRIHDLKELIRELEARLRNLRAEIAGLEEQRRQREKDAALAGTVVVMPPLDVPGVARVDLKPTFIECATEGLLLGVEAPEAQRRTVPAADIAKSDDLKAYLRAAKERPDATVICLIRPGGIPAFAAVQGVAREVEVLRFAKIPVPGDRRPDLSLFAPR